MSLSASDAYLESQVRTATPQRLQLMLIDGALRFARQALTHWDAGLPNETTYNDIVRCRDIIAEIYGGIKQDQAPVAKQAAAIYMFLFRLLSEAPLRQDPRRVRDAVRVLERERETWRLVCAQMPEAPRGVTANQGTGAEITADDIRALTDTTSTNMPGVPGLSSTASGGLSLEA